MDVRYHPFDPDSGLIPEIAEFGSLIERSEGCGIILIGVPGVETPSWCARAAAALVTSWSAQGAGVALADVSLTQPLLHEVFDLPNSEGVTDVMVNGAQFSAVCKRIGSPGFLFVSAGKLTADPADVVHSDQWDIVIKALRKTGVTLVKYAPADLPALGALVGQSRAVLLLGGDLRGAEEVILTLGLNEAPQLGPGAPSRRADRVKAADAVAARAVAEKRPYLRRIPAWKPAAVGGVVGLLALAVWAGSRPPDGGPTDSSEGPEERDEPPVPFIAPPPVVAPLPETPQAYSLSLAAFQDVRLATLQAEEFAIRRADLLFTTVPVRISGSVFHRVLAGPATDAVAAEELRASLGATLSEEDSSLWIVRATPLAFALGDYESREAADRRTEELSVAWLTPYVLEVGASDRPSFRVYAGAYADSTEASVVHERFMELGEEPLQLVRRVGRYVSRP